MSVPVLVRREDFEPLVAELRAALGNAWVAKDELAAWCSALDRAGRALRRPTAPEVGAAFEAWRDLSEAWRPYGSAAWSRRPEPHWVVWQRFLEYLFRLVNSFAGVQRSDCMGCGMVTIAPPDSVEATLQEFCPVCGYDARRRSSGETRQDRRRALRDRPALRDPFAFEMPDPHVFEEADRLVDANGSPLFVKLDRGRRRTKVDGYEVRHLGSGVYTTDLRTGPDELVARHIHAIAERCFPGAVVSDRSAFRTNAEILRYDRALFVVWKRAGRIELPGVSIRARAGARHALDRPLLSTRYRRTMLFHASDPRALLDALRPARRCGNVAPHSMSREWVVSELARWRDLAPLRVDADLVARALGLQREFELLESLIERLEARRATATHP
jgi:hypothetical protein